MTAGMKIIRQHRTTTPARELSSFQTPTEKVFVVYHMGIPHIDPATWHFDITGLVTKPRSLTLRDLAALDQVEVRTFHECAGSPLHPTVPVRRVANVTWRGVRLNALLRECGISPEAKFVWSRGFDHGAYPPTGYVSDSYVKDLPLEKALSDEVLIATELNGAPLDDEHGAPARLVAPGFYGTNSVKWLAEIRLEGERAGGYFTTQLYNDRTSDGGVKPVWAVAPHSLIVSPAQHESLPLGPQVIRGWAWGEKEIARVDVSSDGGGTWSRARLEPRQDNCWQAFSFDWTPEAAGEYELACRATDATGVRQPDAQARNEVFKVKLQIV